MTGFGVIKKRNNQYSYVASGCIRTKGNLLQERLLQIYNGLSSVIMEHTPSHAVIEKIFLKKNVDTALKLGQARGAAFVAVANFELQVAEYEPRVVKKTIVGYGAADKNQVKHMVKMLLCLSDTPQTDAADALAIALCHAHHCSRIGVK